MKSNAYRVERRARSGRRVRFGLVAVVASAALCLGVAPVAGVDLGKTWRVAESENFLVVTDEKPKEAREVAVHFERIRSLLADRIPGFTPADGPPLLVFAPRNEKSMSRLLPSIWAEKGRSKPAGLYQRSVFDQLIVVRADYIDEDVFGVVYHEYFHFLSSNAELRLPAWLEEGLADVWGAGTLVSKNHVDLGRPLPSRLRELQIGRLIALDALFAADRSSPLYRDRARSSQFYAQAWAITHMLLLGDEDGVSNEQLRRYIDRTVGGMDSVEAARASFGDLGELTAKLRQYARRPNHRFVRLELAPGVGYDVEVRDLDDAQIAAYVARFLGPRFALDDTRKLVAQALAGASAWRVSHEAAGLTHVRAGEDAAAGEAFQRAAEIEPPSALAHYGLAATAIRGAKRAGDPITPELLRTAEAHALRALSVDGEYAPALARLGDVYLRLDDDPTRALALARRAVALQPENDEYRLLEAELLHLSGDEVAARRIVREEQETALAADTAQLANNFCWNASLRGFAALVLEACDRAVELDPRAGIFDSRAVARALSGDLDGARQDLRAIVADPGDQDEDFLASRRAWLEAIERGEDPFADGGYRVLAESSESMLCWGC